MPLSARIVIESVLLEHMAHAGTQNGQLGVTYDDIGRHGLGSRNAIALGIKIAVVLGFLDVTLQGDAVLWRGKADLALRSHLVAAMRWIAGIQPLAQHPDG